MDEKLFAAALGGSLTKLGVNGGLVASAGFSLFLGRQAGRQAPVTETGHRLITCTQPVFTQWTEHITRSLSAPSHSPFGRSVNAFTSYSTFIKNDLYEGL